jgi:hypothetical protein
MPQRPDRPVAPEGGVQDNTSGTNTEPASKPQGVRFAE